MVAALALVACGPGRVVDPEGAEPLHVATYEQLPGVDGDVRVLTLSSSLLPCALRGALTGEDEAAAAELALALTREGSRLLVFELRRTPGLEGWEGTFPAYDPAAHGPVLDGLTPRAARGFTYAVEEAVLADEDGLEQRFVPTEVLYVPSAEGDLVVVEADAGEDAEDRGWPMRGRLGLDAARVSARFTARRCEGDALSFDELNALILQWMSFTEE